MKSIRTSLFVFALGATLATTALAQPSRTSFVHLGTSSDTQWPNSTSFASSYDPTGGYVSIDDSAQFTGLDRNGDERTSTFGGVASASSSFGQLRTSLSTSLTNSFFNSANDANGIGHIYIGAAQANFSDTLRFAGTYILPTFKVRYTFFIHGNLTGANYGSLSMDVGSNSANKTVWGDVDGPNVAQYWTTPSWEISPMLSHGLSVNFLAGFQEDTQYMMDGSDRSGSGDFSQTITMTNIEMFDAAGNPFYDFTIDSDSGTVYPAFNAVPEPATMAALGLGALAVFRRRRKQS